MNGSRCWWPRVWYQLLSHFNKSVTTCECSKQFQETKACLWGQHFNMQTQSEPAVQQQNLPKLWETSGLNFKHIWRLRNFYEWAAEPATSKSRPHFKNVFALSRYFRTFWTPSEKKLMHQSEIRTYKKSTTFSFVIFNVLQQGEF